MSARKWNATPNAMRKMLRDLAAEAVNPTVWFIGTAAALLVCIAIALIA